MDLYSLLMANDMMLVKMSFYFVDIMRLDAVVI